MLSSAIIFFRNYFSNDDKLTENLKILQKEIIEQKRKKKKRKMYKANAIFDYPSKQSLLHQTDESCDNVSTL